MVNEFIRKVFTIVSSFSILLQSFTPLVALTPQAAYAQTIAPTDTVTPAPTTATVQPTPTTDPNQTPTASPTITPPVSPTDTVTPTPTTTVAPTPTVDPNATPTVTPTPTDSVTPTATATPTPSDAPTGTVAPTGTATPTSGNITNNPSQAPPTNSPATPSATPSVSPTVTPTNSTSSITGSLATSILKNVSAPTLDLTTTTSNGSANVTTNKADYSPNDTAIITGTNFEPHASYQLTISSTDTPATSTTANVRTDKDGTFTYAYQLDGHYRPNYSVVVKDQDGTVLATTTFTDSASSTTTVSGVACMADQPGQTGLVCTANDTSVSSVSSITIKDHGCRFPGDTVTFTANWQINVNATSRYNMGLWFATAGQTSALHGTCSATSLPSSPSPFFDANPSYTPDTCGDINSGSTGTLSITQTAVCNPDSSGFLKLPYCTSWQQNEQYNGNNAETCKTPTDTVPGTGSKCSCNDGFSIPITVPPSIEVIKSINPTNDPGLFNLQVNATTSATNVTNGGTTGKVGISTGSNTFGEAGSNTSLGNYTSTASCVLRGTQTAVSTTGTGPTWTIPNVTNGQDIVCTITNTRSTTTLTVNKVLSPSQDAGRFDLQIDGSVAGTGSNVGNGGTTGPITVTIGSSHTVSEVAHTGTTLSNYATTWSCTNGTSGSGTSISSFAVNSSTTCTFTNTLQQAHLTLVKTVTNDNGGTALNTAWTLTATGNTPIFGTTGSSSVTNAGVLPGTYTLGENGGPSGYTAGTYSCVKNGGQLVSSNSITLANGDSATCTINNNDQAPSLILTKVVNNNHGGNAANTSWTLTATGASQNPTNLSGQTGVTSGSNFKADTYTLAESNGPSGYTASVWTCTNNVTVTNSQITIGLGQSTMCTITNSDEAPTLHLVKQVTNNNGGTNVPHDWTLTASGSGGFSDSGDSITFHSVTAGVAYTLSESTITGYAASAWSCIGADIQNTNQVTLLLGQNVTCTITNDDIAPSLTLIKQVVGGADSPSSWTLTATGASQNPTNLSGQTGVKSGNMFKADTYTLAESGGPSGYTASTYSCVKNNGAPVSGNTLTLTIGDTATCTITNTRDQGTIELKKVWSGIAGQTTLNIGTTANGNDVATVLTGTNGGNPLTTGAKTVNTNTYYVSETGGLSDYTSVLSCTDNNSPVTPGTNNSLVVAKGHTVICTFTNTRNTGNLTIHKQDQTGNPMQGVSFAISGTSTGSNVTDASGNVTFSNIPTGSYTVTETIPTNYHWTLTSGDCSNANPAGVTVATNKTASCTFVNTRDTGSIIVHKLVDTNGNGTFDTTDAGANTLGFSWSLDGTGTNAMGSTVSGVTTGNHSVSEASVANYHFVGWYQTQSLVHNCANPEGTSLPISLAVAYNFTTDITLCNARDTGTIQVTKSVSPSDNGATGWDFTISGPTNNSANNLHDGDISSVFSSATGQYTVSESGHIGTNANNYNSSVDCIDTTFQETITGTVKGTSVSFTLLSGQGVKCFFTNTIKPGTIIVKKTMVGGTGSFTFTGNVAGIISTDGGTLTQSNVLPGTYTSTETPTSGWDLTGLACDDANSPTPSTVSGSTATFHVDPGETVTCTFTNTKKGHLIVHKAVVTTQNNQNDTPFGITASGSGTITGSATGNVSVNTPVDYEVTPGTYNVSETTIPTGWDLSTNGCLNQSVAAGQTIDCTITNTQRGSVSVTKFLDDNANGFMDEGESALPGWEMNLDQASQTTGKDGTTTFTNVISGNHTLSETPQKGWSLSNIYCTNEDSELLDTSNEHSVNVAPGETVTCFVGNFQNASITVVKTLLDPDGNVATNDATKFDFMTTGSDFSNEFLLGNGQTNSFSVKPGTFDVSELDPGPNYSFVNCHAVYGNQSVGAPTAGGEEVTLGSGDNVTVTCTNQQHKATVTGYKWNDLNGDGQNCTFSGETETCEPRLSGWTIFADTNGNHQLDNGEVSTTTDSHGNYTLSLNPGTYDICEVNQTDWKQTFPGNPTCHHVVLTSGETADTDFVHERAGFDFGNQLQIPVLTISKTNNAGPEMHQGDSVLYTLTVTATQAAAQNVTVTDLLPKGFHYRSGSWTATLNGNPASVGEPTYHSPGVWTLGTMQNGDVYVLTLIADIDGNENPGLYKDVAWAKGQSAGGTTVLATALPTGFVDTNFSGTQVNVVVNPDGSSYQVNHNVTQQVLGASTELPATGANSQVTFVALASLLLGSTFIIIGYLLKRRNNV